ncbi:hypothetical protein ACFW35_18300 [Fictibacillus sp. NPDC058756]|uniref:hypothetical protein n=1 Tax=Fictibacillus sp. NPDC058756 TaxID=3346625 RepID=UPI0036B74DA6
MYKLQFVNTFNQEVLREATYDTTIEINNMIIGFEKASEIDEPTMIICNNRKTWNAEYLFHKVVTEGNDTVYKVFFIVSLSEVQARIQD